jgi:hypothetical protein
MSEKIKQIQEQLKLVKDKYNSFLEECKSLDALTDGLVEDKDLRLTLQTRRLAVGVMIDTKELIIEVDSELESLE